MEEQPKKPNRDNDANFMAIGLRFTAVAFEFVGMLGILGFVGHKVDEKYGVDPWGLLAGLLLGLGLGLFVMYRQLEKFNR